MKIYGAQLTGSIASTGNPVVTGSLTVSGNLTAQQFIVSSSVTFLTTSFSSGSTKFGDSSDDNHNFTGSVLMTGSLTVVTTGNEFQVNAGGVNIGNALTDNHIISGSVRINPNGLFVSSSGVVGIGTTSLVSDVLLPVQINAIATTGQAYFASNNNGGYGLLMGYDNVNGYARIRNVSNTALTFETNNTEKVRITSDGNVGIGVIPSAWSTSYKAVQVGVGSFWSSTNTNDTFFSSNTLYDGSYKYIINGNAASYNQYIGQHIWYTAPSGTTGTALTLSERMKITSGGTVQIKGVGANSDSLIVYYGGSAQSAFQFVQGGSNAVFQGFSAAGVQAYQFHTVGFSYINNSANFAIGNTSDLGYKLEIAGTFKAESKFSGYNTDGLFNANSRPSEIVTPSGVGRIKFGYNDYGAGQYYGRIGFYGTTNWSLGHVGSAGDDFSIGVGFRGTAFYIYSNNNYSFAGSNVSDSRKKANINYITSNQLDTILKFKPVSFNQKDSEGNINSNTHTGFIAQDVLEENIPNLVHGSEENGYGLDYYGILALAVKAIQEQQIQINELKSLLNS